MNSKTSCFARIVLVLVGIFAVVGITPGAAFANISAFTIDEDATVAPGGLQVAVTGTVQCTPGASVFVNIFVAQDRGQQTAQAFGGTSSTILCDGSVQDWGVTASSNSPLRNGPAGAQGTAFDSLSGSTPTTTAVRMHLH